MSGGEPDGPTSVRVSEAAAEAAEAARLEVCPAEGVVWLGKLELRGTPAALHALAARLREAARLAEAGR